MIGPDDPRHGDTAGYHAGCHEACCRRAMARYEKAGRLARLNGGRAVPAIGAQRRLQALMRLGYSSHRIAVEAGLTHRNHVWRIINGQHGKPTTWLQRSTDQWVRDVYDRLSMTIPTGRYVARTRAHAERQGWPPPLAWNNIDDPNEQPTGWQYRKGDRAAEIRELAEQGENATHIARRLGISRNGLEEWCRDNMPGMWRVIGAREGDWNSTGNLGHLTQRAMKDAEDVA